MADPTLTDVFFQIGAFFLGCCLGSFYNVVIYRLPAGESLVSPGSHCPRCNHSVAFYDNIPLMSYVLLRGRCRYCNERISTRYPIVEVLSGVLALLLYWRYGLTPQFLIEFLFVSLLIVITFIDFDTYTIPDVISLPGIVLGFGSSFLTPRLTWVESLLGIVIGGGFFYAIAVGYQRLRGKEGLGGGDIKLLGMIGAFVGVQGVVFTVLVASVVGTILGLFAMWRSRKGLNTMIPFGPFLSIGAISYVFWGDSFFRWYLGEFWG